MSQAWWGTHHIHFDFILKMLSEADICILHTKAPGQGLLELVSTWRVWSCASSLPHAMPPPKCSSKCRSHPDVIISEFKIVLKKYFLFRKPNSVMNFCWVRVSS